RPHRGAPGIDGRREPRALAPRRLEEWQQGEDRGALKRAEREGWTMASVDVRNVVKVYRRETEEVRVLDGLSLNISDGSFVALMGPSGSGKTTLLNLIGGVDQPTSGELSVDGTNIARLGGSALARWRSRSIGFIFQLYNLIPVLTAIENVELPLLLVPMSGAERRKRARTALELVGLGDRLSHYPRQLSGGPEHPVALAP